MGSARIITGESEVISISYMLNGMPPLGTKPFPSEFAKNMVSSNTYG
jgi:hypothetical protein